MESERCIMCGEIIPEGQQLCPECMKGYAGTTEEAEETAEELRDIAEVLKITADTDKNIKNSMEALLRIAGRLERRNRGGEETRVFTEGSIRKIANSREDG